ncbi:hypothetical protein [Leifsonia poae]|uniref:hypothetical protein n=1 Tax=Leifsonia poae TaxID=110933 RepID=UPI003D67925D
MTNRLLARRAAPFAVAGISLSLVLALAGCTTIPDASGAAATAGSAAPAAATYTARELSRVVERAATKLGVEGQELNDQQIKDATAKLGGGAGLSAMLGGAKVTYLPATCGDLITKALSGGVPKDLIAAQLTAGHTSITVSSNDGKPLTTAQKSSSAQPIDDALNDCRTMTMSFDVAGVTTTADLTLKKADLVTKAESTVALEQTMVLTVGGQNISAVNTIVQGREGNLLITVINSRTDQTTDADDPAATPDPVDAVNAVVASAK